MGVFELLTPGEYWEEAVAVTLEGTVELPHVGEVEAMGLTPGKLEAAIAVAAAERKVLRDAVVRVAVMDREEAREGLLNASPTMREATGREALVTQARRLETELAAMRERYGERHPTVRFLESKLAATLDAVERMRGDEGGGVDDAKPRGAADEVARMREQLASVTARELKELGLQVAVYREKHGRFPGKPSDLRRQVRVHWQDFIAPYDWTQAKINELNNLLEDEAWAWVDENGSYVLRGSEGEVGDAKRVIVEERRAFLGDVRWTVFADGHAEGVKVEAGER